MPVFPSAVTVYNVEHCQILECKKDLLLKVNYMVSVTKTKLCKDVNYIDDHCVDV